MERLLAVDAATGAVRATHAASNGLSLTGRAVVGGELWLAYVLDGLLLHLPATA